MQRQLFLSIILPVVSRTAGTNFKNHRFLALKAPFLTSKTALSWFKKGRFYKCVENQMFMNSVFPVFAYRRHLFFKPMIDMNIKRSVKENDCINSC